MGGCASKNKQPKEEAYKPANAPGNALNKQPDFEEIVPEVKQAVESKPPVKLNGTLGEGERRQNGPGGVFLPSQPQIKEETDPTIPFIDASEDELDDEPTPSRSIKSIQPAVEAALEPITVAAVEAVSSAFKPPEVPKQPEISEVKVPDVEIVPAQRVSEDPQIVPEVVKKVEAGNVFIAQEVGDVAGRVKEDVDKFNDEDLVNTELPKLNETGESLVDEVMRGVAPQLMKVEDTAVSVEKDTKDSENSAFNMFGTKAEAFTDDAKEQANSAFGYVQANAQEAKQDASDAAGAAYSDMEARAEAAGEEAKDKANSAFNYFESNVGNFGKKADNTASSTFNDVSETVEDYGQEVSNKASSTFNDIQTKAEAAADETKEEASSAFNNFSVKAEAMGDDAREKTSSALSDFTGKANAFGEDAKENTSTTFNNFSAKAEAFGDDAKLKADSAFSDFGAKAEEVGDDAKEKATSAFDNFAVRAEAAGDETTEKADSAVGFLQSNIQSFGGKANDEASSALDNVEAKAGDVEKEANSAFGNVEANLGALNAEADEAVSSAFNSGQAKAENTINDGLVNGFAMAENLTTGVTDAVQPVAGFNQIDFKAGVEKGDDSLDEQDLDQLMGGKDFLGFQVTEDHLTDCLASPELIAATCESVGSIYSPYVTGVGFRVGDRYIMTAYHLIRDMFDKMAAQGIMSPEMTILDNKEIWIQFDYLLMGEYEFDNLTRFRFAGFRYSNPKLDIVVIELGTHPEKTLPPPLINFCGMGKRHKIEFAGHDGAPHKRMDQSNLIFPPDDLEIQKAAAWCKKHGFPPRGYEGLREGGKFRFQCAFRHSMSGSPGVVVDDGEVFVVVVLTQGYPSFYLDVDEDQQDAIPSGLKLVEASSISDVYLDMKDQANLAELCENIFGQTVAKQQS